MLTSIAHDSRDPAQAGPLRCSPSPFTGNQLKEPIFQRAHHDRLNNPVHANRLGKFVEALFVEVFPRLKRTTDRAGRTLSPHAR